MAATTVNEIAVTDYQAQVITETMTKFGFFDSEEYADNERDYFRESLTKADSYFGSYYEYCNRTKGVRIYVSLTAARDAIRDAYLSLDGAWSPFSQESVDEANAYLARVL